MTKRITSLALLLLAASGLTGLAESPERPAGQKEPFLRIETGGSTALVAAMAFSPTGDALYVASWDKTVHVWVRDPRTGKFVPDKVTYRVPIGGGLDGAISAMALSPDGVWLAVGGRMITRQESGYRDVGLVVQTTEGGYTDEMHQDRGMIYVFNTQTQEVSALRGHWGQVLSMAFAPAANNKPPLLAATSQDWGPKVRRFVGGVRLWDITRGEPVAECTELPDPLNIRPGIAAWHSGRERSQVEVGLAWWDGKFRVWDAASGDRGVREAADGRHNNTVAVVSSSKVLTASMGKAVSYLQGWDVAPGKAPVADKGQLATFKSEQGADGKYRDGIVRAMVPLSSKAGETPDLAALVFRGTGEGADHYQLRLVDLAGGKKFGNERVRLNLWQGETRLPVLAASADGRHLAVAGRGNSAVSVYAVDDLLAKREAVQELRGTGTRWPYVGFAESGKGKDRALGLLLSTKGSVPGKGPREPAAGDVIFDINSRSLLTRTAGWKSAAPGSEGWEATVKAGTKKVEEKVENVAIFTIKHKGKAVHEMAMEPRQTVYDFALLPPQAHISIPVLAVAFTDDGRPRLILYNAETGDPIRWFTGHADVIRALAFSPDGRLLATTGDDQTVCVWSLANSDKFLGMLGRVSGVYFEDRKGGVSVVRVDKGSPAEGKLRADDVIEGVVKGKEFTPLPTRIEFFQHIAYQYKPRSQVTLRVRDANGKRDVVLPVAQAEDERKPLFTLFVSRADAEGQREWIGWHRLGPYDSSGPRAERYVGWHFNTGQPSSPTRFALAQEWRKEYRREGILADLIDKGRITEALQAWNDREAAKPLPAPAMTLALDENGKEPGTDDQGQSLVRDRQVKLGLTIDGFPTDEDKIASLTWQLDDAAAQKFDGSGAKRTADLSLVKWDRGIHRVRVLLRTNEAQPRDYTKELTFRFQPPAPTVQSPQGARQNVADAVFIAEAEIKPGVAGQEVQVTVGQRHGGKDVLAPAAEGLKVKRKLTLLPGDNEINIVAVNKGALAGNEEAETARLSMVVTYTPPKMVVPPQVILSEVQPLPGGEVLKVEAGRILVVGVPRVRLLGVIKATEPLAQAVVSKGEGADVALARFVADKHKTWDVREEVTLEPGSQKLRIAARTADSAKAEASVIVEYRPALPEVALTEPAAGKVFYEGDDPREIEIKASLTPPADAKPYKAIVLVNGKALATVPVIAKNGRSLTAKVPLAAGENRVQVKLTNEWKGVAASEEQVVPYLRPPRNIRFDKVDPGAKAFVDVVARVDSPLPLLAESVVATVNGRPLSGATVEAPKGGETTWSVRLKSVPLVEGDNRVVLAVSNREAASRTAGTTVIAYKPPQAPRPPIVTILDPSPESPSRANDPVIPVQFRVRSASALQSIELVREVPGRNPLRQKIDVPKGDSADLTAKVDLELLAGINTLRLEATNEGGKSYSPAVVVSYSPPPVRVTLEWLQGKGSGDARPEKGTVGSNGRLTFPKMAQGQVRLRGRVIWDETKDKDFKDTHLVQVFVNGFQQAPALLKASQGNRQREFEADIVLNRKFDNQIEVALPSIKQDASNRTTAYVGCDQPVGSQRLHLLVVNLTEQDPQAATAEALKALRAERKATGQISSPAFEQILIYGPLTDHLVTPGKVFEQLNKIERTIERAGAGGAPNDVVLVYYHGNEAQDAGKRTYFGTSISRRDPELRRSAISSEALANRLGQTRGLQLVMLDVSTNRPAGTASTTDMTETTDQLARWAQGTRLGLLRYAWFAGAEAPARPRSLLTDLASATGKALRLEDVARSAATDLQQPFGSATLVWTLWKEGTKLVFDSHLPTGGPADLIFGAESKKP